MHKRNYAEFEYMDIQWFQDKGFATTSTSENPYYQKMNVHKLPKGHGRLIDADTLERYVIEKYSEGEQLAIDITDAPTIIEAESEGE